MFTCGCIVGAVVFAGVSNDALNATRRRNIELTDQLDDMKSKLQQANKFKNRQTAIRTIRPIIEEPPGTENAIDILTESELKKRLKSDLSIFLGRSIYDIHADALFARRLLGSKLYPDIHGKNYIVAVKTVLVVDQELQVWVEAKEQIGSEWSERRENVVK